MKAIFGTKRSLGLCMVNDVRALRYVGGCADFGLQEALIIVDGIVEGYFSHLDCGYCIHEEDGHQLCSILYGIKWYMNVIDHTVIHELIHLCGLHDEDEVRQATFSIHPYKFGCPDFVKRTPKPKERPKPKGKKLVEVFK